MKQEDKLAGYNTYVSKIYTSIWAHLQWTISFRRKKKGGESMRQSE